MRNIFIVLILLLPMTLCGQSKSVSRFRSDYKENTNMFFYSSTLSMLNTENSPEFAEILNGIEEIRVLNYNKSQQSFNREDIAGLKSALGEEAYNNILMINEKGNSINVYSREKKGRTLGMVAIVENKDNLVLIDLIGSIDIKKFMELKQKLETRTGNSI